MWFHRFVDHHEGTMRYFARAPLDTDEAVVSRGIIYLIAERCKGCRNCIRLCPRNVLQVSEQTNEKGYRIPEIAPGKENACTLCGFCGMVCPEFAIYTAKGDE
jgi:2-oxoglutarate ferredoxin oxidoreductase subunit delta